MGRKEKEPKRPMEWEEADPKMPVIHSGHMENRVEHIEKS